MSASKITTKEALALAAELREIRDQLSGGLDKYLEANKPLRVYNIANPVSMTICQLRTAIGNLERGYVSRAKLAKFKLDVTSSVRRSRCLLATGKPY